MIVISQKPTSQYDIYEKKAQINDEIDKLRLATTNPDQTRCNWWRQFLVFTI
jgi:hypothetical protein